METLPNLFQQRLIQLEANGAKEYLSKKGKERNKEYAKAVQCFVDRINKDRKKEKKPLVEFMQIRMKLLALKEVDDLRSWYKTCLEYSYTKDKVTGKRNTFSRGFYGGTKIR